MEADLRWLLDKRGAFEGKTIGIVTSGDDASGINACLRSCVRTAIYLGCKVFFIREGFQGMYEGGDNIVPAEWHSVSAMIHKGGTIIGSATCEEFKTPEGRRKAAANLIKNNISNLVVIGGDGSMVASSVLYKDWPEIVNRLCQDGEITSEEKEKCEHLNLVLMVAKINNDFYGTSLTIGANSALHRITEAIDSITMTAKSHKRTFILEIMGGHCGYLTISAALGNEIDYVFLPEITADSNWREQLVKALLREDEKGNKKSHIVIVADQAMDSEGNRITPEDVRIAIKERLKYDSRITVLGYLLRGGNASAYDRILASRLGAMAIASLLNGDADSEPKVLVMSGNNVKISPLEEHVEKSLMLIEAVKAKDFERVSELRSHIFKRTVLSFKALLRDPPKRDKGSSEGYRLATLNIGNPAGGMNPAVRGFVRHSILLGDVPLAIKDGFKGFTEGAIQEMKWEDVYGWVSQGGSLLGANYTMPMDKYQAIADRIREFNIQGLLLIGGFEAFLACKGMMEQRKNHPEFCIPLLVLPATISNNVPGTDLSVGCDTSLNEIVLVIDRIHQSAKSTTTRCFVVETMGGYCGYLATMSALACGADAVYINEEQFTVREMLKDVENVIAKVNHSAVKRGLVIRNENASMNYNADFIYRLYAEEGKNVFSCRMNKLGHFQEGGVPSPFDRNLSVKMSELSALWLHEQIKENLLPDGTICCETNDSAGVVGLSKDHLKITRIIDLVDGVDFIKRRPCRQWWTNLKPLLKLLAMPNVKAEGRTVGGKLPKLKYLLPFMLLRHLQCEAHTHSHTPTHTIDSRNLSPVTAIDSPIENLVQSVFNAIGKFIKRFPCSSNVNKEVLPSKSRNNFPCVYF